MIIIYSLNIPYADDFHAVLQFLNHYEEQKNLFAKTLSLFTPHNEYKLVLSNLIQIILFWVNGSIDFRILIYMGMLGLFLIFSLYFRTYKKLQLAVYFAIPIPFLLFNLSQYELALWGMASLQGYYQLLFALLSIYFLTNHKMLYAYIFLVFAMFQGGMWMSTFTIFVLHFILTKEYKKIFLTFFIVLIFFILSYLMGFNKPGHNIIENILKGKEVFLFALGVLGSISSDIVVARFIALGVSVLFVWVVITHKNQVTGSFHFYVLTLMIISVVALSINRIHTGLESSISSRYSILSIVTVTSLYMTLVEIYRLKTDVLKKILYFFSVFSIIMYVNNLSLFKTVEERYNYLNSTLLPAIDADVGANILKDSNEKKIYTRDKILIGSLQLSYHDLKTNDAHFLQSSQIYRNDFQQDGIYNNHIQSDRFIVYGSYINSDNAKGSIQFHMSDKQGFLLLTGPKTDHQLIRVTDNTHKLIFSQSLPVTNQNWLLVTIKHDYLPEKFIVEIQDDGSGWGEWSSIAFEGTKK